MSESQEAAQVEPHEETQRATSLVAPEDGELARLTARIATLQEAGAGRFDPARLYYLEVLVRRALAQQGGARKLLSEKLDTALNAFHGRFSIAQTEAAAMLASAVNGREFARIELQRLYESGDFNALRRKSKQLGQGSNAASLSALVQTLEQHGHAALSADSANPGAVAAPASPGHASAPQPLTELKTLRKFRSTWSRLSTDKRIAQAMDQAPKNAGPANPHMLILRSLELMQEISPDYLTRFITYADTLLSLDAGEREKAAPAKKPAPAKKARAPRPATKKSA